MNFYGDTYRLLREEDEERLRRLAAMGDPAAQDRLDRLQVRREGVPFDLARRILSWCWIEGHALPFTRTAYHSVRDGSKRGVVAMRGSTRGKFTVEMAWTRPDPRAGDSASCATALTYPEDIGGYRTGFVVEPPYLDLMIDYRPSEPSMCSRFPFSNGSEVPLLRALDSLEKYFKYVKTRISK